MKNTKSKTETTVDDALMDADGELSRRRIEEARNTVAKALNMLEGMIDEIRWACESENWDSSVVVQIEEASTKLGFALATLTRWFSVV